MFSIAQNGTSLDITALVTNNQNESAFQCWQLTKPFTTSSTGGISGATILNFGSVDNFTYTLIPPRFKGGLHNAPVVQ